MCQIDWKIIQEFVGCLIWPAIIVTLFILFKKQIIRLVDRIVNESNQVDLGGFLKISFKEVEKLKEDLQKGEQLNSDQIKNVIAATNILQIEGISNFGEEYINANYDQRRILESRINDYSIGLQTEELQPLFNSGVGHKIAAAIALETILYRKKIDPADISYVKHFIIESLDNSNSHLRYEALQLIFQSNKLMVELRDKLEKMKINDSNRAIKNILKLFVK